MPYWRKLPTMWKRQTLLNVLMEMWIVNLTWNLITKIRRSFFFSSLDEGCGIIDTKVYFLRTFYCFLIWDYIKHDNIMGWRSFLSYPFEISNLIFLSAVMWNKVFFAIKIVCFYFLFFEVNYFIFYVYIGQNAYLLRTDPHQYHKKF